MTKKYRIKASEGFSEDTTRGNKGAYGELLVCADLLKKGYSVFRAIGPNSPIDIIALKDGKIEMIDVKSGTKNINGTLAFPKKPGGLIDGAIYVVVVGDEIHYLFGSDEENSG